MSGNSSSPSSASSGVSSSETKSGSDSTIGGVGRRRALAVVGATVSPLPLPADREPDVPRGLDVPLLGLDEPLLGLTAPPLLYEAARRGLAEPPLGLEVPEPASTPLPPRFFDVIRRGLTWPLGGKLGLLAGGDGGKSGN